MPVSPTPDALQGVATAADAVQKDDQAVSNASVVILAANGARKSAVIQNVGANNIRVTFDGSAATPTHGLQLLPGMVVNLAQPFISTSAVHAIREGVGDSSVSVVEIT